MKIDNALAEIKKKYFMKSNTLGDNVIQCIRSIMNDIPDSYRIAIRGGGEHTAKLLELIPETKKIIGIFDANCGYTNVSGRIRSMPASSLGEYKPDVVIISSFKYRKEIRLELENMKEHRFRVLDIYDEIEERGMKLDRLFYYYSAYPYCEIIDLQNKLNGTTDREARSTIIETILEKCIDIRDFVTFEKYISLYMQEKHVQLAKIRELQADINQLLNEIKITLAKRKHKDMLMFWNDSVPFEKLDKLPYLKKCSEDSLFFEKAYTVTPYTEPTFMTMFAKQFVIDAQYEQDQKLDVNVFREMEEKGYRCVWLGNDRPWVKRFKKLGLNCEMSAVWGPSTLRYWQMLSYLMEYDQPLFVTVHAVVETHEPYLSPEIEQPEFCMKAYRDNYETDQMKNQINTAFTYWNNQIEFYDQFFQYDCTRIYMSDHGTWLNMNETRYDEKALHTILFVQDKNIERHVCTELFSLYNFRELLYYLIEKKQEDLSQVFSKYAMIQDVDIFDKDIVNVLIANKRRRQGMSFRGVITDHEKYVRLANGDEVYFKNNKVQELNSENENQRNVLRTMIGDDYPNVFENDMFQYSRKLYEAKE